MSPEVISKENSKTSDFLELIKVRGMSFDIDGVDAQTSYPAVKLFNEKFGKKYGCVKYVQDLTVYGTMSNWFAEIKSKYPDAVGDPKQAAIGIWNDPEVLGVCGLESGALALAKFLGRHGIVPYRITSRPSYTLQVTMGWYRQHFPWVSKDRVCIQKDSLSNDEFKKNKILELGIGFHLDDSFKHAEKVAETGAWVGLVIQPWSQNYEPAKSSRIIKPVNYVDRLPIIRAFLSLRDAVMK